MKKPRGSYSRQWLRKNRQPRSAGDAVKDLLADDRLSGDFHPTYHQNTKPVIWYCCEVLYGKHISSPLKLKR